MFACQHENHEAHRPPYVKRADTCSNPAMDVAAVLSLHCLGSKGVSNMSRLCLRAPAGRLNGYLTTRVTASKASPSPSALVRVSPSTASPQGISSTVTSLPTVRAISLIGP